jgi:hypothetical protein
MRIAEVRKRSFCHVGSIVVGECATDLAQIQQRSKVSLQNYMQNLNDSDDGV